MFLLKYQTALTLLGFMAIACPLLDSLAVPANSPSHSMAVYRQLRTVGLDAKQIFAVRGAAMDRHQIHISLQDGTIAFTEATDGHVTGAFFEGEGEILLVPPDQAERASLNLFTHAAILEEKFITAYFRFNDNTADDLKPNLRPLAPEAAQVFFKKWNPAARSLADVDALRMLAAFTNGSGQKSADKNGSDSVRFLHARLGGVRLGTFDVFFDASVPEQIFVAQTGLSQAGAPFYDVWTSFSTQPAAQNPATQNDVTQNKTGSTSAPELKNPNTQSDVNSQRQPFHISQYKIRVRVLPPHEVDAEADLTVQPAIYGQRTLIFELSRYLQLKSVALNGEPVEFIQNEAIEGSQLARRGNDVVAVLLPQALESGKSAQLKFVYGGDVLSEAGGGLMYVGARGAWYPNRGPAMAKFDLEFRYPSAWTLLATGTKVSQQSSDGEEVASWRSDVPIPLAGFNLGQYTSSTTHAGNALIETYAAKGVEKSLQNLASVATPTPEILPPNQRRPEMILPPAPVVQNPISKVRPLTQRAAETVDFISKRLGPLPYPSLSLTQMPGTSSQGWPGLIFLSSYAFLDPASWGESRLASSEFNRVLFDKLMPAHEIAHQWWGDSVLWESYRDQWLMESLANYFALLEMESTSPEKFRLVMEYYRQELLHGNRDDKKYKDAGPVTLGLRLSSSKFPDGYDVVAYGRGTWLIHMVRAMLQSNESTLQSSRRKDVAGNSTVGDELFFSVLRQLLQTHAQDALSTREFLHAFESALPQSLRYENKSSLDWFYQGWINGTAIPRQEINGLRFTRKGAEVIASGNLLQSEAPPELVTSVPIYAQLAANTTPVFVARIFADGPETSFHVRVPASTRRLLLDPYHTILSRP